MVESRELFNEERQEIVETLFTVTNGALKPFVKGVGRPQTGAHALTADLPALHISNDNAAVSQNVHDRHVRHDRGKNADHGAASEKFEATIKFCMASTPERQHLLDGIKKSELILQRKEAMIKNIAELESRAVRDKVPRQEILKLYQNTSRLLDASDSLIPLHRIDRAVLADQVIKNAAHPMSIDQGQHNTCNVTTVEARLYSRYPAEASKLVADIALNGEFVTASGSRIKIDKDNFNPDCEALYNPARPGERSFASQLFEITAANIHWQKRLFDTDGHAVDRGDLRYLQIRPVKSIPNDTGERVRNFHADSNGITIIGGDGKKALDPQLAPGPLQDISNEISGKNETGFVFDGTGGDERVVSFDSTKQLHDELNKAKKQFPLIYVVHTSNEPFRTESGEMPHGAGGWHVVNIVNYNSATKIIDISNQWGPKSDHKISLETLFNASRSPADHENSK
jgi:hypothetical protein